MPYLGGTAEIITRILMLVSYFTYALLKLRVTWECEIFAVRHSRVSTRDRHVTMPPLLASLWLHAQGE